MSDRVSERRRPAQLARHYRDQENLTIAEIARRLGRAEATVKAYLYDPSDANKRPTESPQSGRLLVMHGRRSASGYSAHAAMERRLAFRLLDLSGRSSQLDGSPVAAFVAERARGDRRRVCSDSSLRQRAFVCKGAADGR